MSTGQYGVFFYDVNDFLERLAVQFQLEEDVQINII
jgi:hypothetical protein